MSTGVRVIRFARAERAPHPALPGAVVAGRVLLDESPTGFGLVVQSGPMWAYVLPEGHLSGLSSVTSRQDLEWQIALYHMGSLPVATPDGPEPPLEIAM